MLTPLDLSNDHVKKIVDDKFNDEHFFSGQKGMARFAVTNMLKDDSGKLTYVCTDPARHIFRFKDLEGDLERDVKAKKLTTAIYEFVKSKSRDMALTKLNDSENDAFMIITGPAQDISDCVDDNTDFRIELASLTTI